MFRQTISREARLQGLMVDKVVTEFQSERNRRKRKSDLLYLVLILISVACGQCGTRLK
jgi:hypothetical protein